MPPRKNTIAAKVTRGLLRNQRINTTYAQGIIGRVTTRRMADLDRVMHFQLATYDGETAGGKPVHIEASRPRPSDNLHLQALFQARLLLKEAAEVDDPKERLRLKINIWSKIVDLTNSLQDNASKAFAEGVAMLQHDIQMRELEAKENRAGVDTSTLTDAELVSKVEESRKALPAPSDKPLPSDDDSEPIVIEEVEEP